MKSLSLTIVLFLSIFNAQTRFIASQPEKTQCIASQNHQTMDEKQIKAYNTLYEKMEKWAIYISEQETYATNIPGFFDAELLAQKTKIKSDLAAIRKRIEKIAVAKNFSLETLQVQELAVLVEETTTTEKPEKEVEYEMGSKGGPSGEVIVTLPNLEEEIADVGKGEFVRVLVTWCNQVIKNLNQLKSKLGTTSVTNDGKEALILDFSSTIPAINEIKSKLDANLFTCQTIGEVCDLLLTELDNYNSAEKAEAHYKKYKSIYTADNPNGNYEISPSPSQIKTTLEDAANKEDPNHPDNNFEDEAPSKEEYAAQLNEWIKTMVDGLSSLPTDTVLTLYTYSPKGILQALSRFASGSDKLAAAIQKGLIDAIGKLDTNQNYTLTQITEHLLPVFAQYENNLDWIGSFYDKSGFQKLHKEYYYKGFSTINTIKGILAAGIPRKEFDNNASLKEFNTAYNNWVTSVITAISSIDTSKKAAYANIFKIHQAAENLANKYANDSIYTLVSWVTSISGLLRYENRGYTLNELADLYINKLKKQPFNPTLLFTWKENNNLWPVPNDYKAVLEIGLTNVSSAGLETSVAKWAQSADIINAIKTIKDKFKWSDTLKLDCAKLQLAFKDNCQNFTNNVQATQWFYDEVINKRLRTSGNITLADFAEEWKDILTQSQNKKILDTTFDNWVKHHNISDVEFVIDTLPNRLPDINALINIISSSRAAYNGPIINNKKGTLPLQASIHFNALYDLQTAASAVLKSFIGKVNAEIPLTVKVDYNGSMLPYATVDTRIDLSSLFKNDLGTYYTEEYALFQIEGSPERKGNSMHTKVKIKIKAKSPESELSLGIKSAGGAITYPGNPVYIDIIITIVSEYDPNSKQITTLIDKSKTAYSFEHWRVNEIHVDTNSRSFLSAFK